MCCWFPNITSVAQKVVQAGGIFHKVMVQHLQGIFEQ